MEQGNDYINQVFSDFVLLDINFLLQQMMIFFFIWVLRSIKIISLILICVNRKVGHEPESPEKKKHLTTSKHNLAFLKFDVIVTSQ